MPDGRTWIDTKLSRHSTESRKSPFASGTGRDGLRSGTVPEGDDRRRVPVDVTFDDRACGAGSIHGSFGGRAILAGVEINRVIG
jgi:hypothetical protein